MLYSTNMLMPMQSSGTARVLLSRKTFISFEKAWLDYSWMRYTYRTYFASYWRHLRNNLTLLRAYFIQATNQSTKYFITVIDISFRDCSEPTLKQNEVNPLMSNDFSMRSFREIRHFWVSHKVCFHVLSFCEYQQSFKSNHGFGRRVQCRMLLLCRKGDVK